MPEPKNCLVRILRSPDGPPEGAGALITENMILTCDHVIAGVIHEDAVYFDFPLLDPGRPLKALVARRFPVQTRPRAGQPEDLAVLTLAPDQPLPETAAPAEFLPAEAVLERREVNMCGFPAGREGGHWGHGRIVGETAEGWMQIEHDLASARVKGGFSGGPAWCEAEKKVVGLIVASYSEDGLVSAAYLIPRRKLAAACPELEGDPAPVPQADPSRLVRPGGAMGIQSEFYIRRAADGEVASEIDAPRGLATLIGPRQVGKTSLLMHVYEDARRNGDRLRPVFIDFQAIGKAELESMDAAWLRIADEIQYQLDIDGWDPDAWRPRAGYERNITRFLDAFVFRDDQTPLLICLDEVDRVFDAPIKGDFFSAVRSFFNRGAMDRAWERVRWLISTSSEPAFFIRDLNESPFNVGLRVALNAFTPEEARQLAARHGIDPDAAMMDRIMDYLGGHPFLIHLLFYHMAKARKAEWEGFFNAPSAGNGIFLTHLNRYLAQFQRESEMAEAMRRVIGGKGCRDVRTAQRLEAAGLARCENDGRVCCACGLYANFFSEKI